MSWAQAWQTLGVTAQVWLIALAGLWLELRRRRRRGAACDAVTVTPAVIVAAWFLLYDAVLLWLEDGAQRQTLPLWCAQLLFQCLLSAAAYSLLLLALLPRLRRRFSAVTCAVLWTLPSFAPAAAVLRRPLGIIRVGGPLLWTLGAVWAAGFAAVLLGAAVSHLRFRRSLLKDAVPADGHQKRRYLVVRARLCDPAAEPTWQTPSAPQLTASADGLSDTAGAAPAFQPAAILRTAPSERLGRYGLPEAEQLLCSPAASSPTAIGLFRRSVRIVLPAKAYSDEALDMIFTHELVHLRRGDPWNKLSLVLLAAFAWFLPPMWLGLRRAAEDMELCCDELVTRRMEAPERKAYAALLLTNAGTARGMTTCISASAAGLRYRLQRVLHPGKRRTGFLLIAALLLALLLSVGTVGIAVEAGSVQQVVFDRFPDAPLDGWTHEAQHWMACSDADALRAAIGGRTAYRAALHSDTELGSYQGAVRLGAEATLTLYERGACLELCAGNSGQRMLRRAYYLFDAPFCWQSVAGLFEPG